MHQIGITFGIPQIKQIAALCEEADTIEVKNLDVDLLRRHMSFFRRFKHISMHVQYLDGGRKPTTLNLASQEVYRHLADKNCQIYKSYRLLQPCWVSFHLGFSADKVRTRGCDMHNAAVSPPLSEEETFQRIVGAIRRLHDGLAALGYSREIILENLDYHPTGAYEHVCCPEFVCRVARATGCGILLDLSHLVIASEAFGLDPFRFIERLGRLLIREVHVAAPLRKGGKLYDINQPFFTCNTTTRLVYELACRSRKSILFTLECSFLIAEQVAALREILQGPFSGKRMFRNRFGIISEKTYMSGVRPVHPVPPRKPAPNGQSTCRRAASLPPALFQ